MEDITSSNHLGRARARTGRPRQRAELAKRGPAPRHREFVAYAIVDPEVDIPKLANALMQLAEQQAQGSRASSLITLSAPTPAVAFELPTAAG